jgi:DNA-binding MarR family transcriptional regulator
MTDQPSPENSGEATTQAWGRVTGLDDDEQHAWTQFVESSTLLVETIDRVLKRLHRLTLVDVMVLNLLAGSTDGAARMSDVAHELSLLPSRVTAEISRLQLQGLVIREPHPEDGRSVVARITDRGRDRLAPALRTYAKAVRLHYLDPLTRRQVLALGDSCRRISTALRDNPR